MASDRLTEALRGGLPSLPGWMRGPEVPPPTEGPAAGPRIIDQVPTGDGDVLVTWVLPGLVTAVIRVPQSVWLNGDHRAIGPALAQTVKPPTMPSHSLSDPQDDTQHN